MQLKKLTIESKNLINDFLAKKRYQISAYAFENIIIWDCLYDIFWTEIKQSLCVFFKDKCGCFLYLAPLGDGFDIKVIEECFEIMDSYNKNPSISRIENIENSQSHLYRKYGYNILKSGCDYVCLRESLVALKGNKFKSKRYSVNYFKKNYNFQIIEYEKDFKKDCLDLFSYWLNSRKSKNNDLFYQQLLEDNLAIFNNFLNYYEYLDAKGYVIKIDNQIKAFTFGYELNEDVFVILFEICDLRIKGISQYIFEEFCRLQKHKDINIMDDSFLENLRKVKMSYHPYKIIDKFIARRYE